jgi:hypothetical protein
MCSDFPESDWTTVPPDAAKTSHLLAPLSYYKLSVPVVPLPRELNARAKNIAVPFSQQSMERHRRFLALEHDVTPWAEPSFPTLDWLEVQGRGGFEVRKLGIYDYVEVLEFDPKPK